MQVAHPSVTALLDLENAVSSGKKEMVPTKKNKWSILDKIISFNDNHMVFVGCHYSHDIGLFWDEDQGKFFERSGDLNTHHWERYP